MAEGMSEAEATAAANKPLPFHILTDKAEGGRVPLGKGKLALSKLDEGIAYLRKKFGKDIINKGSELKRPESALKREMFQIFNKELKKAEADEVISKVETLKDQI